MGTNLSRASFPFCTCAAIEKCFGYSAVPLTAQIFTTLATYAISGLCMYIMDQSGLELCPTHLMCIEHTKIKQDSSITASKNKHEGSQTNQNKGSTMWRCRNIAKQLVLGIALKVVTLQPAIHYHINAQKKLHICFTSDQLLVWLV